MTDEEVKRFEAHCDAIAKVKKAYIADVKKANGTEIPLALASSIVESELELRYTESSKLQIFSAQVGYVVFSTCLNSTNTVACFHETQARARAQFERPSSNCQHETTIMGEQYQRFCVECGQTVA